MASRAILQRKRYLFNSLNFPTCSVRGFSSFEHGASSQPNESRGFIWATSVPQSNTDPRRKGYFLSLSKEELSSFSSLGLLRHNICGISTLGCGIRRTDFISLPGTGCVSQYIHYVSTLTAGQPKLDGGNNENEEQVAKPKKEASPEECDQAVEGLSTVKAKAKAKQLQESQMGVKYVIKRVWAMLLGIGPALRAVASMSRLSLFLCLFSFLFLTLSSCYVGIKKLLCNILYILFFHSGRTGLRSLAIGKMNLNLQCNTIGWAQNYFGLMLG